MKLFSPDSKFMVAMGRLGDMVVLNFMFLLTCLPIFTIGAASTALCTVAFRLGTNRENGVIRPYFRAFKANFKQATGMWLILLFGGICAGADVILFRRLEGFLHYLSVPCGVMLALIYMTALYAFPLLSQFNNTNRETLKNALLLSIGYLPRTIVMGAMILFPFLVLYYQFILFFQTGFLWIFLYFSAAAYFNGLILKKVFKPYREEEEDAL